MHVTNVIGRTKISRSSCSKQEFASNRGCASGQSLMSTKVKALAIEMPDQSPTFQKSRN